MGQLEKEKKHQIKKSEKRGIYSPEGTHEREEDSKTVRPSVEKGGCHITWRKKGEKEKSFRECKKPVTTRERGN